MSSSAMSSSSTSSFPSVFQSRPNWMKHVSSALTSFAILTLPLFLFEFIVATFLYFSSMFGLILPYPELPAPLLRLKSLLIFVSLILLSVRQGLQHIMYSELNTCFSLTENMLIFMTIYAWRKNVSYDILKFGSIYHALSYLCFVLFCLSSGLFSAYPVDYFYAFMWDFEEDEHDTGDARHGPPIGILSRALNFLCNCLCNCRRYLAKWLQFMDVLNLGLFILCILRYAGNKSHGSLSLYAFAILPAVVIVFYGSLLPAKLLVCCTFSRLPYNANRHNRRFSFKQFAKSECGMLTVAFQLLQTSISFVFGVSLLRMHTIFIAPEKSFEEISVLVSHLLFLAYPVVWNLYRKADMQKAVSWIPRPEIGESSELTHLLYHPGSE